MGKVAVITGTSSGIGKHLARKFQENGYEVVGLSRSDEGNECSSFFPCDISNEENIKEAFGRIGKKYKNIDILINNAGYGISGATELVPSEEVERLFDVNVLGVINCCKYAQPLMSEGGRIINISSVLGLFPVPFRGLYAASKAAVITISQTLTMECAPFGVEVGVICPKDIKTNFSKNRVKNYSTNERYGERIANAANTIDSREDKRMDVDKACKTIYRWCVRKRLKPLTIMGTGYRLLYFFERWIPKSIFCKIINKMFGGKS